MKFLQVNILALILLLLGGTGYAQRNTAPVDGPYVLYDQAGRMRVVQVDEHGVLKDTVYAEIPGDFTLSVVSHDGQHRFSVPLHPFERPAWKAPLKKKTLVLSDPHGDMESFLSVLRNNGVINKHYAWAFGKNQLIIIGDVFDRGKDVLPIFWLIYKLEHEARAAGGKVTFLLGNHEEMVLRGNLKYVQPKYTNLAKRLGVEYPRLWHQDSELGRWLRSRNLLQIVGDNLFVHAGLSKEFIATGASLPDINEEVARTLYLSKEERRAHSPLADSIYRDRGPFWFRGMVKTDPKYRPSTPGDVDRVLEEYGVNRVFVGHTIFPDITTFFNGKVIGVNVANEKNRKAGKGRGVLIRANRLYIVYDKKKPKKMSL